MLSSGNHIEQLIWFSKWRSIVTKIVRLVYSVKNHIQMQVYWIVFAAHTKHGSTQIEHKNPLQFCYDSRSSYSSNPEQDAIINWFLAGLQSAQIRNRCHACSAI